MGFDGSAVEAIARLERDKKQWFQVPCEPADVYYTVEDGVFERVVAEHLTPVVTCSSTEALLEVAKREPEQKATEIYYSASKVQLVAWDGGDGRIRVHTLPLPLHPVFQLLTQLRNTRSFDQRGLIRFLRAELNAYVEDAVVQKFRHLNLEGKSEGSSVVDKGRAGVSRSVMQTIRSVDDAVPDTITVTTPVYDIDEMLYEPFEVQLLVDCLPDADGKPSFELTTVYSGLQRARQKALAMIAERLSGKDYPVIYGTAQ